MKPGSGVLLIRKNNVPYLSLAFTVLFVILSAASAPTERVLGADARLVYLHGAWVWTALFGILAAALTGLAGLILRRESLHAWSRALGRAGLLLWITFLPLSLVVMQTSWNGLFLAEPRWRLSLAFAAAGLALQIGISLLQPIWASISNLGFASLLLWILQGTANVMHPPAPILNSHSMRIQLSFGLMLIFLSLAGWQIALLFRRLELQGK
ncbi:MAG: hypothetical protein ACM3PY_08350 [Omnitrophica WOR_2 bacterium]